MRNSIKLILDILLMLVLFFGGVYRVIATNSKGKVVYRSKCVYTLESAKEWKRQADRAFPENRNSYEECKRVN